MQTAAAHSQAELVKSARLRRRYVAEESRSQPAAAAERSAEATAQISGSGRA